jgi:hypothetical protein
MMGESEECPMVDKNEHHVNAHLPAADTKLGGDIATVVVTSANSKSEFGVHLAHLVHDAGAELLHGFKKLLSGDYSADATIIKDLRAEKPRQK